jgi:hypothetical protein
MSNEKKVVITTDEETGEELGLDDYTRIELEDSDSLIEDDLDQGTSVEDLDDDEQIWDGGPTAGQIKQWKALHGDVYVTSITFEKHIVWRTLTRNEYKQLVKKMEQLVQAGQLSTAEANLWNEEAITEVCILFPSYDKVSLSSEMAGLPSLLSQEVLEASGFVALEVRQL